MKLNVAKWDKFTQQKPVIASEALLIGGKRGNPMKNEIVSSPSTSSGLLAMTKEDIVPKYTTM